MTRLTATTSAWADYFQRSIEAIFRDFKIAWYFCAVYIVKSTYLKMYPAMHKKKKKKVVF